VIDLTAKTLALFTCLALLLRLPVRLALLRTVAAALAGLFLLNLAITFEAPAFNFDFNLFYDVGLDVRAGLDPYAPGPFDEHPFLNPPTALPLFALFATLPRAVSGFLWTVANVLACFALVALAARVLAGRRSAAGTGRAGGEGTGTILVGLTAVFVISDGALSNFFTGQLSILTALALLLALRARDRRQPIRAGVWLAIATVKTTTMLPFLLLFSRRSDRRTWLALAAVTAGLCLLTIPLPEMPSRITSLLGHVSELSAPGRVNDYSFEGTQHVSLLGFDHALYCLGVRDRGLVQVGQLLATVLLGGWVAGHVLGRHHLPRAAAYSLVALFATVFLYHRLYDTVVLALPLAYCVFRARVTRGITRGLFIAITLATMTVLFLSLNALSDTFQFSLGAGTFGRLLQAVVLPIATWLIVLAMFGLVAAERARRPAATGRD